MQLHYGVKRDNNSKMFKSFGANAGCDCIDSYTPSAQLADLLNGLQEADALPKTILYSLNPIDNAAIGSVMGCFQHGRRQVIYSREAHGGSTIIRQESLSSLLHLLIRDCLAVL